MNTRLFHAARAAAIIALLLALLPWPDSYYEVLRCVILLVALLEMWHAKQAGKWGWLFAFTAVAVIFNPLHVWGLLRWEWSVFDVMSVVLFALGFFPVRRTI